MANTVDLVVGSIVGILGVLIFAEFLAAINTSNLSTAAASLLDIFDLVLIGGLILSILIGAFVMRR